MVFDEEGTFIEDKVTGEKIWATDNGGMLMVQMLVKRRVVLRDELEKARDPQGRWEWRLTSLMRKTLSRSTTKTHDQKIEVQVKKKMSKQDEKTKVKKAGEPKE